MPKTIVSDRDRVFMSKFWKELFHLCGTKLAFSSAYHPETDGQTEVTNRILETYLHCFVSDTPHLWVQYLPLAEFWYNSTFQSAIRMSPFEALYGGTHPRFAIMSRVPPLLRCWMSPLAIADKSYSFFVKTWL